MTNCTEILKFPPVGRRTVVDIWILFREIKKIVFRDKK